MSESDRTRRDDHPEPEVDRGFGSERFWSWPARVAFWGFVAVGVTIGSVRRVLHGDGALMYFAFAAVLIVYVVYLAWTRPPAVPRIERGISNKTRRGISVLTVVAILAFALLSTSCCEPATGASGAGCDLARRGVGDASPLAARLASRYGSPPRV